MLVDEPIDVVDRYIYLGSCISRGGLAGNEISLWIMKASAAFSNLQHVMSAYQLKVEYIMQQCALFCFTGLRPGHCVCLRSIA